MFSEKINDVCIATCFGLHILWPNLTQQCEHFDIFELTVLSGFGWSVSGDVQCVYALPWRVGDSIMVWVQKFIFIFHDTYLQGFNSEYKHSPWSTERSEKFDTWKRNYRSDSNQDTDHIAILVSAITGFLWKKVKF